MPAPLKGLPGDLTTGEIQSIGSIHIVPLRAPSRCEPPYRVLEDDVVDKVTISEVNESGSVPTLTVTNTLDVRVFLMDGQELAGAKQNRMLNADVLVPANTTLNVPVSCVERGRWSYNSSSFSPSGTAPRHVRAAKSPRIHASLRAARGHDADQGEVWRDVDETLRDSDARSPSDAVRAAFERHTLALRQVRDAITMPDDAIGVAVFHEDRWLGTDIFDRHSTLKHFWDSLIDSYVLDRLAATGVSDGNSEDDAPGTGARPSAFDVLNAIHSAADANLWESFTSPGEGADLRLADERWSGAALQWDDHDRNDDADDHTNDHDAVVLHLQLFPGQQSGDETDEGGLSERPRRPRLRSRSARLLAEIALEVRRQADQRREQENQTDSAPSQPTETS